MVQSTRFNNVLRPGGEMMRLAGRAGSLSLSAAAVLTVLALATGGGVWWFVQNQQSSRGTGNILLHTVERGNFELTITERGEVEAFDVTEVRSLVKSNNTAGNAILKIVPEGTIVKQGDFLVELDSSALKAQRTSQKILVNAAKAAEVEAHNTYDTAIIAKREYLDGTYLQERQVIESEIFVAEENLNRSKEYYAYSEKLASKGYVNELQLEADRFAVEKANKDLDAARTKLRVLDDYTKPKMLSTLESAILIAQAKWDSAQNSHELEVEKLQEFDDQVDKCNIVAPQDGVVKYAHVMDGRGDQEFIVEEGTTVRERQVIITLPRAEAMRVELTVNESLVQYIQPGLPAMISPVGFGDRVLSGVVEKVNQYAEPTGWRQANVKEYKAIVSIDDVTADLRAGMTASVSVRCAEVPNALQVPVQAVYAHGSKFYCFVHNQGSWEAREVRTGPTNDKFFVIESGLNDGDQVAMTPRTYADDVALPELSPDEAQRAVPQRARRRRSGEAGGSNTGPRNPNGEGGRPGAPQPGQGAPGQQPAGEPAESPQQTDESPRNTNAPPTENPPAAGQVQTAAKSSQGTAQ